MGTTLQAIALGQTTASHDSHSKAPWDPTIHTHSLDPDGTHPAHILDSHRLPSRTPMAPYDPLVHTLSFHESPQPCYDSPSNPHAGHPDRLAH